MKLRKYLVKFSLIFLTILLLTNKSTSQEPDKFIQSVVDEASKILLESEKNNPSIIANNTEALVSSDFTKNTSSVIVDHRFLKSEKNFIKLLTWYDNEWGYSSRVVDLVEYLLSK